jgi:glycosyltransferase involved in cell wall biosynthesis
MVSANGLIGEPPATKIAPSLIAHSVGARLDADLSPPRLILLASYGGPYAGSFIPMARALAEGVRGRGWEAELAFPPRAEPRDWFKRLRSDSGAAVRIVPDGSRRRLAAWLRERLDESRGPALVHTHFTQYDLPAVFAARGRPETAVVWHVHTPFYPGLRARARSAIKYRVLGRPVTAILVSGPDPARGVIRAGAPRSRIDVVGNGIETARFTLVSDEEREVYRERLELPRGARILLHFGWDWYLKDGDLFLAAVRELLDGERGGTAVGVTVRGGEEARTGIDRLGLQGDVRIVEPVADTRELYGAADVFVSSSRVEGQPFAVIEAICSGAPVVATDLPGHRDICAGLVPCRVVERSPEAMAGAIAELLARPPEEARRAAREARAAVAARFDLEAWTERMLDRYERYLAEVSGSG